MTLYCCADEGEEEEEENINRKNIVSTMEFIWAYCYWGFLFNVQLTYKKVNKVLPRACSIFFFAKVLLSFRSKSFKTLSILLHFHLIVFIWSGGGHDSF